MAVRGEAGRDDDMGTMGWQEAGQHFRGSEHELVQPLRVRRRRRLDVSRGGGFEQRSRATRLQAYHRATAARRRLHLRDGYADDTTRRSGIGLEDRWRPSVDHG